MKTVSGSLLLVCCSAAVFAASSAQNIAVGDLTAQGVDQSSAAIITDRLRTELFKTGAVTVIERQAMEQILKEQGFQQTGCTSDLCMVEMGQLLGVSLFVAGTLGHLGDVFTMNIRVIDVATGEIVFTESVDCDCPISKVMTVSTPDLARRIAAGINLRARKVSVASQKPASQTPRQFGSLVVRSTPPGAKVLLDNTDCGVTPFSRDSLPTAKYRLKLDLAGYDPAEEELTLSPGRSIDRSYSLKHSTAWQDSVRKTRNAERVAVDAAKPERKKRALPKILLGAGAVGGLVLGVVFNGNARVKIDENASLKSEYATLPDDSRYAEYQQKLSDNQSTAEASTVVRNICYVAAGLCAAGFAVSFAF